MSEEERVPLEANSLYQIDATLPLPPQPVGELMVTIEDVREVLAHTEIIETDQGDLIASPDQVWLVPHADQQVLSWEVEVNEEQFWLLVGAVYGEGVVAEMKQEFEDTLRWEQEGGSCLS